MDCFTNPVVVIGSISATVLLLIVAVAGALVLLKWYKAQAALTAQKRLEAREKRQAELEASGLSPAQVQQQADQNRLVQLGLMLMLVLVILAIINLGLHTDKVL